MTENPKKILVVDDEVDLLRLMKKILEGEGYTVFTAEQGAEGLSLAKQEKPDLIFLDVRLPDRDGYEILEEIKSDKATRSIPVVMLTSLNQGDDFQKALDKGVDWYITKPFEPEHILKRAKDLLKGV